MNAEIKNDSVVTRFPPSPTGFMHLGNVRTALFNFLFAKRHNSTFLLRIEDTDKVRSQQRYADMLLEDLKWLELTWQEGLSGTPPRRFTACHCSGAIVSAWPASIPATPS